VVAALLAMSTATVPPGGDLLEPRAELTDRRMVGGAAFVVDGKIGRRGETSRGETVGRGITLPRE
jgi:hypothetical protein